jgi:hypothetical protein
MPKRIFIGNKQIDGFSVIYEKEGGQIFAYAECPQCGTREESVQTSVDAGVATASKIKVHMATAHGRKKGR